MSTLLSAAADAKANEPAPDANGKPSRACDGWVCVLSGVYDCGKYSMKNLLQENGAKVVDRISKATTHLIAGKPGTTEYGQKQGPGSTKWKEAKKKKLKFVTEAELIELTADSGQGAALKRRKVAREEAAAAEEKRQELADEAEAKAMENMSPWQRFDVQLMKCLRENGSPRKVGGLERWYGQEEFYSSNLSGEREVQPTPLTQLSEEQKAELEDAKSEEAQEEVWRKILHLEPADECPPAPLRLFVFHCNQGRSDNRYGLTARTSIASRMRFHDKAAGKEFLKLFPANEWDFHWTEHRKERMPDRGDMECATPIFGVFFVNKAEPRVVIFLYSWASSGNLWTW